MRKLASSLMALCVAGGLLTGCSNNGNDETRQGQHYNQPYFPSVHEGLVYFGGGDGRVRALEAKTGQQKWATKVITEIGSSTNFSLAGGSLIYRDARNDAAENSLTAVDPATGKERWHTTENGVSFTASSDEFVYYMGVDAEMRLKLEIREADSGKVTKEATLAADVVNGPALHGDMLYFAGSNYNVYVFDTKTGEGTELKIQDADTSIVGIPDTEPKASDTAIFLGTGQTVYALDRATGKTLWKFKKTSESDYAFALADGKLVLNDGKAVVALDEKTGAVQWRYEASEETSYPYAADGTAYVNSGNSVIALSVADGAFKWQANTEGRVISLPAYDAGALYFGDDADRFYAVDAASGKELWRYAVER